ncbi:MAG: RNA polymerase sigma factor [Thermoanaerobaculia bacterium]|nr:RNA polymerase sigma factor [Thermoanaerobaculia bacterium]
MLAPPLGAAAALTDAVPAGDELALGEEAFRALHAATARPLWAYLAAAGGDPALADDLLQESYLRLLRAARLPADADGRRRYLYRIATNLLHDHRRAARRRPGPLPAELPAPAATAAPDRVAGADLARLLRRLRPRERQLLWLAHVEGASHAEIAAATGVAAGSVRVLLFRARQKLAALLAPAAGPSFPGAPR